MGGGVERVRLLHKYLIYHESPIRVVVNQFLLDNPSYHLEDKQYCSHKILTVWQSSTELICYANYPFKRELKVQYFAVKGIRGGTALLQMNTMQKASFGGGGGTGL